MRESEPAPAPTNPYSAMSTRSRRAALELFSNGDSVSSRWTNLLITYGQWYQNVRDACSAR
jgi:hypothetical protein